MIDEIQDILAGSKNKQKLFQCVIKQLGNDLKIPIIAAGTIEALSAVNSDPQLSNRFNPLFIPVWEIFHLEKEEDEPFLRLLTSYEKTLNLKHASDFGEERVYTKLLSMCEGLIGELASILALAAEEAITTGEEKITLKILQSLDWTPPSDRMKPLSARRK